MGNARFGSHAANSLDTGTTIYTQCLTPERNAQAKGRLGLYAIVRVRTRRQWAWIRPLSHEPPVARAGPAQAHAHAQTQTQADAGAA
jgi:hypothetical protein